MDIKTSFQKQIPSLRSGQALRYAQDDKRAPSGEQKKR
jgi:hypothetical protein